MICFKSVFLAGMVGLALLHVSCGSSSSDGGGTGESTTARAVTTLESSLISDTILESVYRNSGGILAVSGGLNETVTPCPSGAVTCFTPSAFGGLFDSFSVRVSQGGTYISLTLIPSTTAGTADKSFDFGSPSAVSGSYECCDGESWENNEVQLKDMIWTLGAIEFTFDGEELGFTGTHSLKLVYADNEALGYERGDVLLKVDEEYSWCPTTATTTADCSTTRMESPITQESAFVDYEAAAGDPQLPYFDAELYADEDGTVQTAPSSAELTAMTFAFTVDFDMEDSLAVPEPDASYSTIFEAMSEIYARGLNVAPTGTLQSVGMNAVVTAVASE